MKEYCRMRSIGFISLILMIGSFFQYAPVLADDQTFAKSTDDPAVEEFIRLLNGKRHRNGCPELKWDDRAASVARSHSRDMARRDYFSHTNPEGRDSFDRLRASHISFSLAGENIAVGVKSGQGAYELWLNSPAHRENMLDCRFTHQGVGKVGNRWTQILLRPLPKSHRE
jgi:uncharacterized protein YkwD